MNPERVREIIKSLFSEYSEATIREGSVVVDQIVNPLALLGAPLYNQVNELLLENSVPSYGVNGEILDKVGERLLAPRVLGSKCQALIRVAVSSPGTVSLRQGSTVSTGSGIAYRILNEVKFSENSLTSIQKWRRQAWVTPEISVEAVKTGPESFASAGDISIAGFVVPNFLGVYNEEASTPGTTRESNNDYIDRLRLAVLSRSWDTPSGIFYQIPSKFGDSIQNLSIHGAGDQYLTRDKARTRRLVSSNALDITLSLLRTSDDTTGMIVGVNGLEEENTFSEDMAWFQYQEIPSISSGESDDEEDLVSFLRQAPYGAYLALFFRKNVVPADETREAIEEALFFADNQDIFSNSAKDYVIFGRKGDPNFQTRQIGSEPNGNDTDVHQFQTIILEQIGEGSAFGFRGKTKGLYSPNASRLLTRSAPQKLLAPGLFSEEVSQENYNLVSNNDFQFIHRGTGLLFEDNFTRLDQNGNPITRSSSMGNGWICGNTGERKDNQDSAAGVYIYGGKLVFGSTRVETILIDESFSDVIETKNEFRFLKTEPINKLNVEYADPIGSDKDLVRLLNETKISAITRRKILLRVQEMVHQIQVQEGGIFGYKNNFGATSPVIQRPVEDPFGFSLSGTFRTTDEGTGSCAITMARNGVSAETPDVFRWYEGYGVSFNTSVQDGLPNIFVVDNASTSREMVVAGDELVNGKMNHNVLAQRHANIVAGTDYHFEIVFGGPEEEDPQHAISMECRIWPLLGTRPSLPTISYGAYIPTSRRSEKLLESEDGSINTTAAQTINSNHIGIGISESKNDAIWVFDNIKVENVDPDYAQMIAEVDIRGASKNIDLKIVARGSGSYGNERAYGHSVHLWNPYQASYVEIGNHDYDLAYLQSNRYEVELAPYALNGKIILLITSKYPHQGAGSTSIESYLDLDYLIIEDYNDEISTGGKADIFFTQKPGEEEVGPSMEYYTDIAEGQLVNEIDAYLFGGPIEQIIGIEIVSGGGNVELTEDEFRFYWDDPSLRGSTREKLILVLDESVVGLPLRVHSRNHTMAIPLQDTIESSTYRKIDSDLLCRHRQSIFIDIEAEGSGNWTSSSLQDLQEKILYADELSYQGILEALGVGGLTKISLQGSGALSLSTRYLSNDGGWVTSSVTETIATTPQTVFVPGEISITVT